MAFIKNEFKLENFALTHEDPDLFLSSRWQERYTVSRYYLAYRCILALYHVAWLIFLVIDEGGIESSAQRHLYFLIYLTNWAYMTLTLLNVVWGINMIRGYFRYQSEGCVCKGFGLSLKLQWFLQNITFMPAMLVTLVYWASLYTPGDSVPAAYIEAHAINTALVLLDIFVIASPIRLLHFLQPIVYLILYVIFSIIYYVAGGTTPTGNHYIYPVLDWEKSGETCIYVAGAFGASLVFYVFTWLLFVIREQIYSCSVQSGTTGTFFIA